MLKLSSKRHPQLENLREASGTPPRTVCRRGRSERVGEGERVALEFSFQVSPSQPEQVAGCFFKLPGVLRTFCLHPQASLLTSNLPSGWTQTSRKRSSPSLGGPNRPSLRTKLCLNLLDMGSGLWLTSNPTPGMLHKSAGRSFRPCVKAGLLRAYQ